MSWAVREAVELDARDADRGRRRIATLCPNCRPKRASSLTRPHERGGGLGQRHVRPLASPANGRQAGETPEARGYDLKLES